MLERVDENTIMVVPTFGVTYTGSYEPVLELSQALDKLQEDTGLDIDIHVDGASGAFLAPFCAPDIVWDFRIPRVKSISTSGHKFGLAPLGVGWVLWRDVAELPDDLIFHVTYLGRRHAGLPDQLLASGRADRGPVLQLRPAGPGRATAASTTPATTPAKFLGRGDRQARARSRSCATANPLTGIPSVAWRIREGEDPGYTLYDIADRLRVQGLAGAGLPADRIGVRHLRPADPGAPGRQPRPGLPAARRHQAGHRPLRQASRSRWP